MNFTRLRTKELWTHFKSCFTRLAISSGRTRYWDFVNFASWPVTISYWSWGHATDWTLFCFELICCLNDMNKISSEIVSFIEHKPVLCLRKSRYPLLFLIPRTAIWSLQVEILDFLLSFVFCVFSQLAYLLGLFCASRQVVSTLRHPYLQQVVCTLRHPYWQQAASILRHPY